MKKVGDIRKDIYDYHRKYYSYIFDEWKWYHYRKFKAKLYMDVGAVLTYFFIKMKVKPNIVTLTYGIMGLVGGILLAIPLKMSILIGIALFYFSPFLDWSDGPLARETRQTSITGGVLDPYGALLNWVPLWAGIGLYVANRSGMHIFYYMAPIMPTIFAMDIFQFCRARLFEHCQHKHDIPEAQKVEVDFSSKKMSRITTAKKLINRIFEHNAGTVDFICLVILVETFSQLFISWIIYLSFLAWQIIVFIYSLYRFGRGGWAEEKVQDKMRKL